MPCKERGDFRVDCYSELDAIDADTLHPLSRFIRAHLYGLSTLVRSPLIRREFTVDRPVVEPVVGPRWMLQVSRTRFMFMRGVELGPESASNRRFMWLYHLQRVGGVDGATTAIAIGVGFGLHLMVITTPWPGRMGMLVPRTRFAISRDGRPLIKVEKPHKLA